MSGATTNVRATPRGRRLSSRPRARTQFPAFGMPAAIVLVGRGQPSSEEHLLGAAYALPPRSAEPAALRALRLQRRCGAALAAARLAEAGAGGRFDHAAAASYTRVLGGRPTHEPRRGSVGQSAINDHRAFAPPGGRCSHRALAGGLAAAEVLWSGTMAVRR